MELKSSARIVVRASIVDMFSNAAIDEFAFDLLSRDRLAAVGIRQESTRKLKVGRTGTPILAVQHMVRKTLQMFGR